VKLLLKLEDVNTNIGGTDQATYGQMVLFVENKHEGVVRMQLEYPMINLNHKKGLVPLVKAA